MSITSGNLFRTATVLSALSLVQKTNGNHTDDSFFYSPDRIIVTQDVDKTVEAVKAEYDLSHVLNDFQKDGCHYADMITANIYENRTYAAKQEGSEICFNILSARNNGTCISTEVLNPDMWARYDNATAVHDLNACQAYLNLTTAKDAEFVIECEWNTTNILVTNCSDLPPSGAPSVAPSQKESNSPTPVVIHPAISSADVARVSSLALAMSAGAILV